MVFRGLQWVVWAVGRAVMALRYRITFVGMDEALRVPGPYLILPNHPAFCDPPNILVRFWPYFKMRPMLLETMFRLPPLAQFAWVMRSIPLPDIDQASVAARERVAVSVGAAVAALRAGENVVLWPAGRIMRDGVERIGGTRGVAEILAGAPHATVVLVRSRGFWGSMYTWAPTATRPPFIKGLFQAAGLLIANLLIFAPKRSITMTVEAFSTSNRPAPVRELLNPWLERWYNADVCPEVPTFVPHHFLFGPRTWEFPPRPVVPTFDPSRVKEATKIGVAEILAEGLKRPLELDENRPEATFMELGLDSLDAMDVTLQVERRFGFAGPSMPTTVGHLWALAEGYLDAEPSKPPQAVWFKKPTGSLSMEPLGATVTEGILNRVLRHPHDIACSDDVSGAITYERFLIGAMVLAERFEKIPEPNVGLLMPASTAGMVALVGLYLAKKLPVILNWTTGPANMTFGIGKTGVRHVVTSRRFIDRSHIEVPGAELVYLEDIRSTIGRYEKLRRGFAMKIARGPIVRSLLKTLDPDPDKPAVVLFTSGSEKAPKAVPLTHRNVIADMQGAAPLLGIDRSHVGMVLLPLFHSFGYSVTGIFPLFGGIKVVYHPDPTDAGGLVRKVAAYKPTAIAATPTFFGYMLDRARPGDLDSLKIVIVGAERCPDSIFDRAKALAPNAVIVEGYGITECSPVISLNPLDAPKRGTIGRPVQGVEICITHPDTGEKLPDGQRGMVLVAGPTVFPGYIGDEGTPPFRVLDGKKWYVTGDLGEVGCDGYVRFHGRLRRFLKAAGEMISLPAMEEPFARLFPPSDQGPRVAVEGIEMPERRHIVLFTTEDYSLKDANGLLAAEGFRGIIRLDEVQRVPSIPVLGTGKTDYKVLRARIESEHIQ